MRKSLILIEWFPYFLQMTKLYTVNTSKKNPKSLLCGNFVGSVVVIFHLRLMGLLSPLSNRFECLCFICVC